MLAVVIEVTLLFDRVVPVPVLESSEIELRADILRLGVVSTGPIDPCQRTGSKSDNRVDPPPMPPPPLDTRFFNGLTMLIEPSTHKERWWWRENKMNENKDERE